MEVIRRECKDVRTRCKKIVEWGNKKMTILNQIDEAANLWNKTKNPKYKKLYKLIKEFVNNGLASKRRVISISGCNKTDDGGYIFIGRSRLFDLCDILRLHLTTYHEPPFNVHVMNDGSGYLYGCICY